MSHSLYSPSGSKGWMACAGRITLEALFPNRSGPDADIGTACHTIAQILLTTGGDADKHVGNQVPVHDVGELTRTVKFTEDMAEWVQTYVDSIRSLIEPGDLHWTEYRVDFSHIAGIPDQSGTLDKGILKVRLKELQVHDLKTGRHPVAVEQNPQLMIYALGLLRELELTHDIEAVRVFIHQPRLRSGPIEWACTVDELVAFGKQVNFAINESEVARREYEDTGMTPRWAKLYLHSDPNEVDCAWCRAMAMCPAKRAKVERDIGEKFESVIEDGGCITPATLNVEALNQAMNATGAIEDWIKAVRAEVERRLLAGEEVADWGLELGRQGARKWQDEDAVESYLTDVARLPIKKMCETKLKSPTQLEKLAAKPKDGSKPVLGAGQWKKVQQWIDRSDAKPSVKPKSQITEPYSVKGPDGDAFGVVEEKLD